MMVSSPYIDQIPWSDTGPFAGLVAAWPVDPSGLSKAIADLVVHVRSDEGRPITVPLPS